MVPKILLQVSHILGMYFTLRDIILALLLTILNTNLNAALYESVLTFPNVLIDIRFYQNI